MVYQASKNTLFSEVSKHFCEYCNLGRGTVRFLCDGTRVEDSHTMGKVSESERGMGGKADGDR
jgi:hypothetical protein